jgi:dihydroxy-acid dehydratase
LGEELRALQAPGASVNAPAASDAATAVLYGNLAPDGALATAEAAGTAWTGRARVFTREPDAVEFAASGAGGEDDVLVIRGVGPHGGPGMPHLERLAGTLGDRPRLRAVVTDGRIPSVAGCVTVSHVGPEAALGGPIAYVTDGATIVIDLREGRITTDMLAPDARRADPAETRPSMSALDKYRAMVRPAREGAVTQPGAAAELISYPEL